MAKVRTGGKLQTVLKRIVEVKPIKIRYDNNRIVDAGEIIIRSVHLSKVEKVKVYVYQIPKSQTNLQRK